MNEIRITEITVAPEAKITKGMTLRGPGFILPVTYTLADGRTIASHVSNTRKKDVLPQLERERANAASGAMKATFDSATGRFFGTCTSYNIGAQGLVAASA